MYRIGFLFWFGLINTALLAGNVVIVPSVSFGTDTEKQLIVCNADVHLLNTLNSGLKTGVILDGLYDFVVPVDTLKNGFAYSVLKSGLDLHYTLYFTSLPLIFINSESEINGESFVFAEFLLAETNKDPEFGQVGIRYRGSYSQIFPKKSFRIEFWADPLGNATLNKSLLGMRSDDDWILHAMYNEPLRLRSKTNNALWQMIHQPYYLDSEPEAKSGIQMEYAEVFMNNEYRGVYCLSERIDRQQLKLKKFNGSIRGELYKGISWGASTFGSLPPFNNNNVLWGGFEYIYPDELIDWSNLYDFVNFVLYSDSLSFYTQYSNHFRKESAVDYFLFLNLLRATDNTGKNIFIARYNAEEPYFYVPWDLDGTFGIIYDGSQDNTYNDMLSNGFYNRLWSDKTIGGFRDLLKNRWNDLKLDIISHDSIMSMFMDNYHFLHQNAVYERESIAWPEYSADASQLAYMSNWISLRASFLNQKFNEVVISVNDKKAKPEVLIYPNPVHQTLFFKTELKPPFKVMVHNNMGQVIVTYSFNSEVDNIDVSHWQKGIYLLAFSNDKNAFYQKVIIK